MAQLRLDYQEFQQLNAQVIVIVPNGPLSILRFWSENDIPLSDFGDKGAKAAEQFGIRTRRLGLAASFALFTPAVFVVDRAGIIRYAHYEKSYLSEPDNQMPLALLGTIAAAN